MSNKNITVLTLVFIAFILIANPTTSPVYTLKEGTQAIVTQFGQPIGNPIIEAGLHFKVPVIQKINYFEKRILAWDGDSNQIPTKDKRYIWVDTTARWRIKDPLRFFQSVSNEMGAHARLDDIIDSAVRDAVTSQNLIELVRSSNRLIDETEDLSMDEEFIEEGVLEEIKTGRDKIRQDIIKKAKVLAPQYGIELIDVRVKRLNYVEEVKQKVYERMIAERRRAAEQYRSEGRGIRAEIEGRTEKELKTILSEAYKKSQEIKGSADAQATKIYAGAYNKDPEFFSFLKTLETYRQTVDENTTALLTTDGEYFKYLNQTTP